jgi:hypothetical protein
MPKKKRKKILLVEAPEFKEALQKSLGLYSCCSGTTRRVFIGASSDDGKHCVVLFRGGVDDIFAVKEFLEKRK